jgi:hypothetical protein
MVEAASGYLPFGSGMDAACDCVYRCEGHSTSALAGVCHLAMGRV